MSDAFEEMKNCRLCPRNCGADRTRSRGFCGEGAAMRISRAALHMWEEPVISGSRGSGAVFFTGCNLKCIFCQNAAISDGGTGREVTPEELADIFFDLKEQGAHNINLVTPSHFTPGIIEAIRLAKKRDLGLPFVWNSSGFELAETLCKLEGLIDVYLPDYKYHSPSMPPPLVPSIPDPRDPEVRKYHAGSKEVFYSSAPGYSAWAKLAIEEMFRQVGTPVIEDGLIKRGVIVRHLVMPLGVKNACEAVDYLAETYGDDIYISIMNQYTPLINIPGALREDQIKRLEPFPELHRKVTKREYRRVIEHCLSLGLENVFIQEEDASGEDFIPTWDL